MKHILIICETCKEEKSIPARYQNASGGGRFCSTSCAAKGRNLARRGINEFWKGRHNLQENHKIWTNLLGEYWK